MDGQTPETETFDEARVAERILVAATALGPASAIGWVVPGAAAQVKALLGVPADRTVRTLVSLGDAPAVGHLRDAGEFTLKGFVEQDVAVRRVANGEEREQQEVAVYLWRTDENAFKGSNDCCISGKDRSWSMPRGETLRVLLL